MKNYPVRYTIRPLNPAAHRFEVSCEVATPAPEGQRFSLPAWIPGSYLIRDFARHIVAIRAEAGGKPVHLCKLDKQTWQAEALPAGRALTVTCEIHAWDLSVRGAHLDQTHGFFNGTSVFLRVLGPEVAAGPQHADRGHHANTRSRSGASPFMVRTSLAPHASSSRWQAPSSTP